MECGGGRRLRKRDPDCTQSLVNRGRPAVVAGCLRSLIRDQRCRARIAASTTGGAARRHRGGSNECRGGLILRCALLGRHLKLLWRQREMRIRVVRGFPCEVVGIGDPSRNEQEDYECGRQADRANGVAHCGLLRRDLGDAQSVYVAGSRCARRSGKLRHISCTVVTTDNAG